jgi:hypothetical protein
MREKERENEKKKKIECNLLLQEKSALYLLGCFSTTSSFVLIVKR